MYYIKRLNISVHRGIDGIVPPILCLVARFSGLIALFLLASVPAFPQQSISAKAGSIQFIQGEVFLNEDSILLQDGDYIQMKNDQILTTGKGYAELLLTPYSYLRLGEYASLRVQQTDLTDIRLELNRGSAMIEILKKLKTDPIRVHVSQYLIEMKKGGLYRIDAESRMLRVYGGDALATREGKKVRVKNGRMIVLNNGSRSEKFDPDDADPLHWWAARRSFTLFAKNLFFINPGFSNNLAWKSKEEGLYNSSYRVTVPVNEDWKRYWSGVWSVLRKRMEERNRRLRADPGPLPVPPLIIPEPPEQPQ